MREITQQNQILKIIEYFVRSNIYFFIFSRFLVNKFFCKYIYESDFRILKYLKKDKIFSKGKKIIIDIGANDGISVQAIRNFIKDIKIYSFEPSNFNFKKLKMVKKKFKNLKIFNLGLSNNRVKKKRTLFQPYYKSYQLSPFDSLRLKDVFKSIESSLFIKNIKKKIKIKKSIVNVVSLDNLNLRPGFIKIDIQGHEYNCILGAKKTIQNNLPIIMLEYDEIESKKIYNVLRKMNYKKFLFRSKNKLLKEHNKEKIFNIFFIHGSKLNLISKDMKIEFL